MAKKKLNIIHFVLMLFVCIMPVFAQGFDKNAMCYASLSIFCAVILYRVFTAGRIVVTKTILLMASVGVYALVGIIWVSDKGSQFALASVFLLGAAGAMLASDYKKQIGEANFNATCARIIYLSAFVCACVAILYQVFIENRFLACNMNFGNGSSAATATLMLIGVISGLHIFKNRKRQPAFIVSMVLTAYVFVMAKSLVVFLMAAVILFTYAMRQKHKKVEALISLVVLVAVAVINLIGAVLWVVTNSEVFSAAMSGLVSLFGVGSGGYNAAMAVVDRGYASFAPVINLFMEAFGVAGIVIIALIFWGGFKIYVKTRRMNDLIALFTLVVAVFSSSASLVFMLPMMAMYCSAREEEAVISLPSATGFVMIIPCAFYILLASAHIPYALGKHAVDMGRYEQGARYYEAGASMELFSSYGWVKAFEAESKAFEESGMGSNRTEYIENAIKYNNKNYKYRRYLADTYTASKNFEAALEVWEGIITRHDKEYLYPMYGIAVMNVMENCPIGLERMEELYNTLAFYANKAEDKAVKLEVNNILAKSQQYYVNAREGTHIAGDMYMEEAATEVEYASSYTES